jgi:flagellar basal-body rod modification protein FlgD
MDYSNVISNSKVTGSSANTTPSAAQQAQDTQDRFLKMLVAQMKNQDPMNPMDNAQVTSQMAQIQTVTGISNLNDNIKALGSQFGQMQALQSVNLVGREVLVPGSKLSWNETTAKAQGSFEIASPADAVKLEVLAPSGAVVDTVQLGAQGAGVHDFDWSSDKVDASAGGYTFRITASKGASVLSSTAYAHDKVVAVNTDGSKLQLQLASVGMVDYSSVKRVD